MTSPLATVALAYRYPGEDSHERLAGAVAGLPDGALKDEMTRFVVAISRLDRGEWEELHTRTLDLSPLFVPYVGHVIWGESYRRGAFMAGLRREQLDSGVDAAGELPDHVAPILSYLDRVSEPPADLVEVLPQAVSAMRRELGKAEPDNPYRHLLAATVAAVDARLAEGATP